VHLINLTVFILLLLNSSANALDSPIKNDEVIIFFPEIGYPSKTGNQWELRIHGWIYEPEWTSDVNIAIRKLFGLEEYHLEDDKDDSLLAERAKLFFVDNQSGKRIPIQIGNRTFISEKSASNGHFYGTLRATPEEVAQWQDKDSHTIRITAITKDSDHRKFTGQIYLLETEGTAVISDIDDTIKISEVFSKEALLANTFIRPFRPVPEMAKFYQQLAKQFSKVNFHYVSASPWQLYPSLQTFLQENHFPLGSVYLRTFSWKNRLLHLFQSTKSYKLETIEQLLHQSPQPHFILIGDSGEQDADIYAQIARKYPHRIRQIFIHEVPRKGGDKLDYQKVFANLPPSQWTVFSQATSLLK